MGPYAKAAALCAVLAIVTGCGTGALGGGRPCTLVAAREGVGLDVASPLAARVESATVEICWNGTCHRPKVVLSSSTRSVPQGCEGDGPDAVCGASASPTGGKHGFAAVHGLPKSPVRVVVTLRGADGARLLHRMLDVTPKATFPNGPHCGEGRPQATLAVADGRVSARG